MSLFRPLLSLVFICPTLFAEVYMGTGAQEGWTPLFPSTIAEPIIDSPASPDVTSVIPNQPMVTSPGFLSQPSQFTGTYSPSASSYSSTNYAAVAPLSVQNRVPDLPLQPCQGSQVDLVYGKGPLVMTPCPSAEAVLGERPVSYTLRTGSLKYNITKMVRQSGWGTLVWNVPNDYRWVGNIEISATSIQGALDQLLAPYPVQAVFYDTNHVIDIEPRRQA